MAEAVAKYIEKLHKRSLKLKSRGNKVLVSIFFFRNGQKISKAVNDDRSVLRSLKVLYEHDRPEKVEVHITSGGKKDIYPFQENPQKTEIQKTANFEGFGATEVEEIVRKRLDEELKEREFAELRLKLSGKETKLSEIILEKQELEEKLRQIKKQNKNLKETIQKKEKIRYYAGFAGDILQSFGIDKSKIREPLAGFLTEEEEKRQLQPSTNGHDHSSIELVNEQPSDPELKQRNDAIQMIRKYLNSISNKELSGICELLGNIQDEPGLLGKLLEYIKTKKESN